MWRRLLSASVLALIAGAAAAESKSGLGNYTLQAMPLKEALSRFAQESGLSISYDGLALDDYRSGYVIGAETSSDALSVILERSPFTFEFAGEDTVRLVAREQDTRIKNTMQSRAPAPLSRDTILVTATKRLAYAQKIPAAISAVDGGQLRDWGVRDLNALAPKLAGVAFTNLGPSRNKVFLRGISDGSFADRTQSTIGVYLDETPIIFNDTNPDLRLIDVDRIEIIRGPQGTLYGAGSIGGVYRMIANKPDTENYSGRLRASISTTKEGGANGTVDGVMNIPVVQERIGLRAAGYYENVSGYIDDVQFGAENINHSQIYGGRVGARFVLSENWTADAAANAQVVDLDDTQYIFANLGGLRRANFRREPYRDEFRNASLTFNGNVGAAKITSSSALIRRDIASIFDATPALPDITGGMTDQGVFEVANDIRTFNHESRIVSDNGDNFKWLFGGFYSHRRESLNSRLIVDSFAPASIPFFSDREDKISEFALFSEISFEFIEKVTLTAGLRWWRTKFDIDVASGGVANTGPETLIDQKKRKSFSPKVAFSYEHDDDLLFYIQTAQGSRIGGFNVSTPLAAITMFDPEDSVTDFESDKLWNTEFGVKSSWLDGNLIMNASAFYVRWSEIQTDQILPNGFSFIANAGKARNYGFEAELAGRPLPNLEIAGAFFWNNPELTEANPFLGAEVGDALPNISSVSASVAASYGFPVTTDWRGAVSADYSYVGRSFLTFAEGAAPSMGDYHVANLQLVAQKDQLRVGLYANNLTDERGNTFAFGNPFSLENQRHATPVRPLTIGAFIEVEF